MPFAAVVHLFCLLWIFAAMVLAAANKSSAAEASRPNVIIILSDDQGYGDFSCHGNPVLKTPNLDRLHSESVRLTDFHVAPMCTPTRGQLLTGVDACRNGATSVCAGRSFVRRGIPTMAEYFSAKGYKSALFGKWHLGDSYPNLPHFRGFDDAVYHLGWGITSMADTWLNDYFDGGFFHNGKLEKYTGYCTDVWFDLSLKWMKERAAAKEPFFLYLPTNAPHGPHWVPDKYRQVYQGQGPAAFFGMIANLDDNVGRLEKFLAERGLRDNSIVIFFNDNGGTAGTQTFNAGMRGRKTMYYEGGHRAACFIRWPNGKLGEPRDINELTQVQDLLPTLIDLCELKSSPHVPREEPSRKTSEKQDSMGISGQKAHHVERDGYFGASLAGLLKGTSQQLPDRKLVVQYGQRPVKWDSAVMWQKWRLVKGEELYDLRTDPGQEKNVATDMPEILTSMREHYEKWWVGIEPRLDDFTPIVLGSEQQNPVTLSAADWANVYCDNMGNLRNGDAKNSFWTVLVEQDGDYEISLRRWPKAADAAISTGVPEFRAVDGTLPAGKALPVAKVRLKIGDFDQSRPVQATDKEVLITLKLKAGTQTTMQSWLLDAQGNELAGAYFADVRRK